MPRPRPIAARPTTLWAAVGVALLAGAPILSARAEVPALAGEIAVLQGQLASLRRLELTQATDPQRLAQYEVRLGQLEEELRRLTGRIEQLEYGQRTIEGRLDQLIGDLDQRLRALEQGGTAQAPLAALAPAPRPVTAPPATAPPATVPPTIGQGAPPQDLGQIPKSAVLALPRPTSPPVAPPPSSAKLPAQQQYDSAMELLRAGDYAGAEAGLQLFLDLYPDHPMASNAAYWLAETYYVRKNYAAAAAAFARNYRTYGKTAGKAPDNLLKLGMSLEGLGERDKACLSYAELAKEFPTAPAHIQQALGRERARAECA